MDACIPVNVDPLASFGFARRMSPSVFPWRPQLGFVFKENFTVPACYVTGIGFLDGEWWPSEICLPIWRKTEVLDSPTLRTPLWSSSQGEDCQTLYQDEAEQAWAHLWVLWVTPEMTLAQARLSLSLGVLPPGLSHWPVIRRAG